jgi:hypothetical protein
MEKYDPAKQLQIKKQKHYENLKYKAMVNSGKIKGGQKSKKQFKKMLQKKMTKQFGGAYEISSRSLKKNESIEDSKVLNRGANTQSTTTLPLNALETKGLNHGGQSLPNLEKISEL